MSAEELPVQRDARQWKKFGACVNAPGPERGITIVCDRRPVEFSWIDLTSRRFSPELTLQMKDEWSNYRANKVLPKLRAPAPTASAVPGPQSAPKTTVNQGGLRIPNESVAARSKQHSQVGESTSPIAPTAENQHAQDPRDDSVLKMQPVGRNSGTMSGQRKLGSFASQSTLHTEAPEFIPKGTFNPQRTAQPVQLLNNDVHPDNMPQGAGDRPFGLPDPQRSNESREMNGNAINGDDESARRNEQLLNMKAKLKGHYRLLYSKYKEYVQKRVPEKIEEYYIRLKHCQAQYMKLKYYEYKAHAQAPNMRNNQIKGPGPSDPHPSHSSPQRPGQHGGRGGVVPQNNPWTSRENGGGDRGGINDGYGYNSGWGGGGGGRGGHTGGDQRGFSPRDPAQEFGANPDDAWGQGGGGGFDHRRGGGQSQNGSQNGHGSYSGFGGGQSMWENNSQQSSYNGGGAGLRGRGGGGAAGGRRGQDRMMNDGGNGYGPGDYGRPGPNDHMNGGGYGGRHAGGQNRY